MNADRILSAFADQQVDCLLIGGMNFLLRHQPINTFDVDLWVMDTPQNLARVNAALIDLQACWGPTEATWGPVPRDDSYLRRFPVYCFTSAHGALDVFRYVKGLEDYSACKARSLARRTENGAPYQSLSDADMLACQMALPPSQRRLDRVAYLENILRP